MIRRIRIKYSFVEILLYPEFSLQCIEAGNSGWPRGQEPREAVITKLAARLPSKHAQIRMHPQCALHSMQQN